MSAPKDLDRQIESFLLDGPMELPEPSYAQVRDRIEQKRQRADFGLWRTSLMSRNLKYGLTVAAGVLVVVIGYQLIGGSSPGGPAATETPQPSVSSEPSASSEPTPSTPADGSLPVGLHVLDPVGTYDSIEDRVTVTIPAPGWFAEPDEASVTKDLGDFGSVTVVAVAADHYQVPRNICNWQTNPDLEPGNRIANTVDELVAYLTEQTYDTDGSLTREFFTPPADITLDGYPGQRIHDLAPAYPDSDASDCDEQRFCSLLDRDGYGCLLSHLEPGAIDTLWIVDLPDSHPYLRVIASSGYPNVEFRPEIGALVDSMTFHLE